MNNNASASEPIDFRFFLIRTKVTRSSPSASAELYQRTWTVTFVSPDGDVPQIQLGSDEGLTSFGNDFTFATIQDGTAAGG